MAPSCPAAVAGGHEKAAGSVSREPLALRIDHDSAQLERTDGPGDPARAAVVGARDAAVVADGDEQATRRVEMHRAHVVRAAVRRELQAFPRAPAVRRAQQRAVVAGEDDRAVHGIPGAVDEHRGRRRLLHSPAAAIVRRRDEPPECAGAEQELAVTKELRDRRHRCRHRGVVRLKACPPSREIPSVPRSPPISTWRVSGSTNSVWKSTVAPDDTGVQLRPSSFERRIRPAVPVAIQAPLAACHATARRSVSVVSFVAVWNERAPSTERRIVPPCPTAMRTLPVESAAAAARSAALVVSTCDHCSPSCERSSVPSVPQTSSVRPSGSSMPPLKSGLTTSALYSARGSLRSACPEHPASAPNANAQAPNTAPSWIARRSRVASCMVSPAHDVSGFQDASGSVMLNVVPTPGVDVQRIVPPCASTMPLAM
jgi:hypothetical protein